ncbi:MAG: hypothetical protein J6M06_02040, partial [Synergistaceae bacterium]|nr:hypothetical protein [Synergistaceae bacterium]
VLDVFHRNKALLSHVQDPDYRKLLMKQLYDKNIPLLLACIEVLIDNEEDPKVQEHYRTAAEAKKMLDLSVWLVV